MSDRARAKKPPPPPDDPRFLRTCTRCYSVRGWKVSFCQRCKNPEFMTPETAAGELQWLFDQNTNPAARAVDESPSRPPGLKIPI